MILHVKFRFGIICRVSARIGRRRRILLTKQKRASTCGRPKRKTRVPAVTRPKNQQGNKVSKMTTGTWEDRSCQFLRRVHFRGIFSPRRILPNGKVLRPTREMTRLTPMAVLEWLHYCSLQNFQKPLTSRSAPIARLEWKD